MSVVRRATAALALLAIVCAVLLLPERVAVTASRAFLAACFALAAVIAWRKVGHKGPRA
ncbi:MAG: hypothetical protein WBP39_08160 [Candidatus Phosphoribacter baldrii]